MTGSGMGGGSADKAKQPQKPPEKIPPPEVTKLPQQSDTNRSPEKPQQDGKGGKDSQSPAGPQGGKPAEVPGQAKGDAKPQQTPDTSGKQTGDGGQRRGGDAPAKTDGSGKPGDASHQPGDQHPGWKLSTDPSQFQKQFERLEQPHQAGQAPSHPTDTKGAQQLEKPQHRLDLDQCRGKNGKLDPEKLQSTLENMVKQDIHDRLQARLQAATNPDHQGPRPGSRAMEVTVRVEKARSYPDAREVETAMQKVCDKYHVNGRVEVPGRRPAEFRPHGHDPCQVRDRPLFDPGQIHRSQDQVRPQPGRQVPTVPPRGPNPHQGR